jgi:hypothetical protein
MAEVIRRSAVIPTTTPAAATAGSTVSVATGEVSTHAASKESEKEASDAVDWLQLQEEEEYDETRYDVDLDLHPIHEPPDDPNDDTDAEPLDAISLAALKDDPDAVLFHHLVQVETSDDRTPKRLMYMTFLRAYNVSNPEIENVKLYVEFALQLQYSLDHFNADSYNGGGVYMSALPRFVIGRLQTCNLIGDIVYWLGRLGRIALLMTLNELVNDMHKTFKIPKERNPLQVVSSKVASAAQNTIRKTSSAFVVLGREFINRHGETWRGCIVYDDGETKSANKKADAANARAFARLHVEYIQLLVQLVEVAVALRSWIANKEDRIKQAKTVIYTERDVGEIRAYKNAFFKATKLSSWVRDRYRVREQLYEAQTLSVIMQFEVFSIASALSLKSNQLPNAWYYCAKFRDGWFSQLRNHVANSLTKEIRERVTKGAEPAASMFDDTQATEHYLIGAELMLPRWELMRLVFTESKARPMKGMNVRNFVRDRPSRGVSPAELARLARSRGRGRGRGRGASDTAAAAGAGAGAGKIT